MAVVRRSGATIRTALLLGLFGCGRIGFDAPRVPIDGGIDVTDAAAEGWTRIVAGDQTTCGIRRDRAFCWGRGTNNEIGDGGGADRAMPAEVALPAGLVTDVTLGEKHGCALVDSAAYCWGSSPPGNGLPASTTPVAVMGLPSPVTSITAGGGFTCAIANAAPYCWGSDGTGRLGNGGAGSSMTPQAVVGLLERAISIDAGNDHAIALLADGTVWAWGHNDSGALGIGSTVPTQTETPLQTFVTGTLPSLAGWHACSLASGSVECWGLGTMGELGDGLSQSSATARTVDGLASVDALAAGGGPTDFDATCAANGGAVWCWGNGRHGRLGQGSAESSAVPVLVQGLPSEIVELALGYGHSCARSGDGRLWCWGRGDFGQLGDGRVVTDMTPVEIAVPP